MATSHELQPKTEASETSAKWFQVENHEVPMQPEVLAHIGQFPVTNSSLMMVLMTVVLLGFGLTFKKKIKLIPGFFQSFIEWSYESIRGLLAQTTGSEEKADKLFPLVGSVFFFLVFANLFPLLPGITSFTFDHIPLFRLVTTDFNLTFSLALSMIFIVQFMGIRENGFFPYVGRFIKIKELIHGFKQGIGQGFLALIEFFIGFLEIIAEIVRIVSLSLRLFGNLYAEKVLTGVILGLIAYIIPAAWMGFGILVGIVQAMVFTLLVTVYISLAKESSGH